MPSARRAEDRGGPEEQAGGPTDDRPAELRAPSRLETADAGDRSGGSKTRTNDPVPEPAPVDHEGGARSPRAQTRDEDPAKPNTRTWRPDPNDGADERRPKGQRQDDVQERRRSTGAARGSARGPVDETARTNRPGEFPDGYTRSGVGPEARG